MSVLLPTSVSTGHRPFGFLLQGIKTLMAVVHYSLWPFTLQRHRHKKQIKQIENKQAEKKQTETLYVLVAVVVGIIVGSASTSHADNLDTDFIHSFSLRDPHLPAATYYHFADATAACHYYTENFCKIDAFNYPNLPVSACVSSQFTDVALIPDNSGNYLCRGTVTEHFINSVDAPAHDETRNISTFVDSFPRYAKLVDLFDSNPGLVCAGDPIEVGTGVLYETETDVEAKGPGQVKFVRSYSTANAAVWRHNYQQSLTSFDLSNTDKIRSSTGPYSTLDNTCSLGAANVMVPALTQSWAKNTTVSRNGNLCQFSRAGVVTRNLLVLKPTDVQLLDWTYPLIPLTLQLSRADGSIVTFQKVGNLWQPINGTAGIIEKIDSGISMWKLTQRGTVEEYSAQGKLVTITAENGVKQQLYYDAATGALTSVQDSTGNTLSFTYDQGRIASVTTGNNRQHLFTYNSAGSITDIKRPDNTHRVYYYEDSRFPTYLTGITDERGVRFATWSYDAQGHAISSEHAGGADKTVFAFNADGSTTVTNALNKQTIYRFADIVGARRVTSVQGQPTANCLGTNQNYTYTAEGWLASKTDWNGNKTVFSYNAKGQEISRTEAYGSPVARTITTEWHPTLNLKTKVTEQDSETTYSYAANGLLLTQSTRSLP